MTTAASDRPHRPNLFIVGAMKCGTTILYDFLTQHADISGGVTKECHYFSLYHDKGDAWYLDQFRQAGDARYLLDASPTYFDMALDHPTAERIKSFSPDARIIILVRNPVERAASHFHHLKTINKRPELEHLSFDDLVARNWPATANPKALETVLDMVLGFSRYAGKITRYIEVFGKDNVLVIHNDDLWAHGAAVMDQVFGFLDLQPPQGSDFTKKKYVHSETRVPIATTRHFSLLQDFGQDYYMSCKGIDARRPVAPPGSPAFNQPVGALLNEVGVGEDGWLYLATGSNNALGMFIEPETEHLAICSKWHGVVRSRRDRLAAIGARHIHMMIPEKMTVLGDKLHWPFDTGRSRGLTFNRTAPADIQGNLVDLVRYFRKLDNVERFYSRTDSHWNSLGAFVAYQLVCSSLGFAIRNELLQRPNLTGEMVLDLASKLPDRPREAPVFKIFRQDSVIVSDAGLVRFKRDNRLENDGRLHTGSIISYRHDAAPNRQRIVIFGDSFSEYRDHLLTALMAETFAETTFVWSADIDYKLCDEIRPDIVFCFMTERFTFRVPADNLDIRAYAAQRIAEVAPSGTTV